VIIGKREQLELAVMTLMCDWPPVQAGDPL
jgi:hypothetical protein